MAGGKRVIIEFEGRHAPPLRMRAVVSLLEAPPPPHPHTIAEVHHPPRLVPTLLPGCPIKAPSFLACLPTGIGYNTLATDY